MDPARNREIFAIRAGWPGHRENVIGIGLQQEQFLLVLQKSERVYHQTGGTMGRAIDQ
ncbi:hypothetical protein D1872_340570 [compost metagenome]